MYTRPPFVMVNIKGTTLTEQERALLAHPSVAGLTLFARNYRDVASLTALTKDIKSIRKDLLIAVDHEGGVVQRFKDPFTVLPPMRTLGAFYEQNKSEALAFAQSMGWLMAMELRSVGIDINFAPVVDLDFGKSSIIGDRTFHRDPNIVAELAERLMEGMLEAGVMPVAKHFPGHGGVALDSHIDSPKDERTMRMLENADLIPYHELIAKGTLPAVMMSHVAFMEVSPMPAGYSQAWVTAKLRDEMNFKGYIFTDCLSMKAAHMAGDMRRRIEQSIAAGCNIVLICNHDDDNLLEVIKSVDVSKANIEKPKTKWQTSGRVMSWEVLQADEHYQSVKQRLLALQERISCKQTS